MTDERLRGLERAWRETGAADDLEALITARKRAGQGQERLAECRTLLERDINNEQVRRIISLNDPLAWTGFARIEHATQMGGRNQGRWTRLSITEGNHPPYHVRIARTGSAHIALIGTSLYYQDREKHLLIDDKSGILRGNANEGLHMYEKRDGTIGSYQFCTGNFFTKEKPLPGAPIRMLDQGPVLIGINENGQPVLHSSRHHGIQFRGPIAISNGNIYHRPRSCYMLDNKRVRTRQAGHDRLPEAMRQFSRENFAPNTRMLESIHETRTQNSSYQPTPTLLELPINVLNALRTLPNGVYQ